LQVASIAENERVGEVDIYRTTIYGWLKLTLSIAILDHPIYFVQSILAAFTSCAFT
jgi:hypothetical protein